MALPLGELPPQAAERALAVTCNVPSPSSLSHLSLWESQGGIRLLTTGERYRKMEAECVEV